jgi:RNA polymerase sigma-32 factor
MYTDDEGLRRYVNAIQHFEPLDRETELELALRWKERGDERAAHALVQAHLLFVVKVANGYRGYGIRVADLVEEGNVGLLEAVRRFDPARNLRFMTYAAYWIRAYVLGHVLRQRSMVGVGTGPLQSKLFFRLARERARITSALGANAAETDVEALLAQKFGTSAERIRSMTDRLDGKDVSLDAKLYHDSDMAEIDLLPDAAEGQEERVVRLQREQRVRKRLQAAMRTLSPRERYLVNKRMLSDEEESLAEIGRHLGLTRERVRQIESRVKQKLRHALVEFRPIEQRA